MKGGILLKLYTTLCCASGDLIKILVPIRTAWLHTQLPWRIH